MSFNIPSAYERVISERLDDLNGNGIMLYHKKTGARIALIINEDDNKVFSIGFRTPPKNSTGVAHIVEHCVLCGSRSFPAKDPFIELAKGSLNTFLNAMTYSDRTLYPIASQNMQDFKNLMHVYLDAVFYPNIYNRKEIFLQEGWHYELEDEAAELKYNGVVYNEMKGAFSSPEQQLYRISFNSLFPDTPYGVESGGDPDYIPDLSYEEFIDFHRTYYHPSNSYIYLYGDMDFEERLNWLDENYLSRFDRLKVDSEISYQKSFDQMKEISARYPLGEEEEMAENTYLSYNCVIGSKITKELNLSFMLLDYVLLDAPGAPVKQALINAGIGRDILSSYSSEYLQSTYSIVAKNTDENKKEQFLSIIREVLEQQVSQGLDEKSLRAAINYYEFKYREADYGSFPKGLMYGIRVASSWFYNDDKPFENLKDSTVYEFLKEKIGTGYYEELIQKYILNNNHASLIILQPEPGLNAEKDEEIKNKLKSYKDNLSKEEVAKLVEETKALRSYQDEPSTTEELACIPMLAREDIGREVQPIYNDELSMDGIKVIHHNVQTNDIAYIRLLFDVSAVKKELLPYLSLLSLILGYTSTTNYSYQELSNEVNINTGGISSDVKSFSVKNSDSFIPVFEFSTKVLYNKLPQAFELIEDMISNTIFDDTKRLKEIIDEMKSRMQMRFNQAGHSVAVSRAMSYYSRHGLFKEITTGITFYKFLEEMADNYQEKKEELVARLSELTKLIFTRENLFVSLTADDNGSELFRGAFLIFIKKLSDIQTSSQNSSERTIGMVQKRSDGIDEFVPEGLNEGFKAAMQVQYVARAGNFFRAGFTYTGALRVLRIILSYDYLWNNIRVKGGAYGCMCGFSGVDGDAYFTSYRDPNLKETNKVYEGIVDFVRNYNVDERDITKNIIGTISSLDTPLTPQQKGSRSLSFYLAGVTIEELQKERDEILNVTIEDIRNLAEMMKSILDTGYICVIGNEKKIEENRELFKEVKKLIK